VDEEMGEVGEGNVESIDDDVEYNPWMKVSPIDVLGPPARRVNWRRDNFRGFHRVCGIKKFSQRRSSPNSFHT